MKFYGEILDKPCNFCSHTKLSDLKFPIEKINKLFMNEFLEYLYNRPEELVNLDPEV